MVRISEELVRKKCEHNEGEICSLEELSLHQESIEKIEYLQNWCRELKILLFHSNLIAKIENVNKLKKLEYLNLSLNNIDRIENLEGCEFLEKLDLTLNFVGELTSIQSLVHNIHLKTLYLTGNPCTDFCGYRAFVVATLPQLKCLDGVDIERSERIEAVQNYESLRKRILIEQEEYNIKRYIQKAANEKKYSQIRNAVFEDNEEKIDQFWKEPSDNSPETRIFIEEHHRRKEQIQDQVTNKPKRVYRTFDEGGLPLNINEARIPFTFKENDDSGSFVLDVAVYKYLDTSLLEVDAQPTYIRVTIKGKVLQLVLPKEIKTDSTVAQRSQTTGHLVITLPKVNAELKQECKYNPSKACIKSAEAAPYSSKREMLEIGSGESEMDFGKIVDHKLKSPILNAHLISKKSMSSGFIENPDVPPLE